MDYSKYLKQLNEGYKPKTKKLNEWNNVGHDYIYQIEYWVDEEAREYGLGDIYGSYKTLEEAKREADRLFDNIAYDGGSVEVQDLENDCEVVYFLEPSEDLDESKKKTSKKVVKESKALKETFESDDVYNDLVDRAKLNYSGDVDDAVSIAIDEGLIYDDDIFDIAKKYLRGSDIIDLFYEDLFSDLVSDVEDEVEDLDDEEDLDESKKSSRTKKRVSESKKK